MKLNHPILQKDKVTNQEAFVTFVKHRGAAWSSEIANTVFVGNPDGITAVDKCGCDLCGKRRDPVKYPTILYRIKRFNAYSKLYEYLYSATPI